MAEMTIEVGPEDLVVTKDTDSNGRLYLGKKYENKRVRAVVEVLSDDPETDGGVEQDPEDSDDAQSDSEVQEPGTNGDNEDSEDKEGEDTSWLKDGEESE